MVMPLYAHMCAVQLATCLLLVIIGSDHTQMMNNLVLQNLDQRILISMKKAMRILVVMKIMWKVKMIMNMSDFARMELWSVDELVHCGYICVSFFLDYFVLAWILLDRIMKQTW